MARTRQAERLSCCLFCCSRCSFPLARRWPSSLARSSATSSSPCKAKSVASASTKRSTLLNVPSASIALIDEGRIAFARAYGKNATPDTLYQAASLSKFVAAIGAMRLVENGTLNLDEDVNETLTAWKVPGNAFDVTHKVTLRGLLSMTGGIGVPGFLGYDVGVPLPTLTQTLDGITAGKFAAGHGDRDSGQRLSLFRRRL